MHLPPHRTAFPALLLTATLAGGCASTTVRRACEPAAALRWAAAHDVGAPEHRRVVHVWMDVEADGVEGWGRSGASRVRRAIERWNALSLPVALAVADTRGNAEVTVSVIRRFPPDKHLNADEYRAGLTTLTYDSTGQITRARVLIAGSTPYGLRYPVLDQEATLLHELGHALGLPHVSNPVALMYSRPRATSITPVDAVLAKSVYLETGCPRFQVAAGSPGGR